MTGGLLGEFKRYLVGKYIYSAILHPLHVPGVYDTQSLCKVDTWKI